MKRLLIFELHLLGDAVMGLPFLHAARKCYDVYVCCSPTAAILYERIVPEDHLVRLELPLGEKRSLKHVKAFFQALRALRKVRADLAVTVWADVRIHLLMRLLRIPERIGFPMNEINYYAHHLDWRRRNLKKGEFLQRLFRKFRLLTASCDRHAYLQHHVEDWKQLAEVLGLPLEMNQPWLDAADFPLPESAQSFFLRNRGKKIWLLHPGAGRETKQWPHYSILVQKFFAANQIPLVILEDPSAPRIEAAHDNCLRWPMSSLPDFVALVAASDFVLCNDSAAAHFGASLKKHVVAVFGSGSAEWFAPYATPRTVIQSFICPYRPCYDICKQPSIICLADISASQVLLELEALR